MSSPTLPPHRKELAYALATQVVQQMYSEFLANPTDDVLRRQLDQIREEQRRLDLVVFAQEGDYVAIDPISDINHLYMINVDSMPTRDAMPNIKKLRSICERPVIVGVRQWYEEDSGYSGLVHISLFGCDKLLENHRESHAKCLFRIQESMLVKLRDAGLQVMPTRRIQFTPELPNYTAYIVFREISIAEVNAIIHTVGDKIREIGFLNVNVMAFKGSVI